MKNKNSGRIESSIEGQRFGRLVVIERITDYTSEGHRVRIKYRCQCDCGNITESLKDSLLKGRTKSCGCLRKEITTERVWKGYGEISGKTLSGIKNNAKSRNVEYNVSNEFIWDLFLKQDRKCALTGYDIAFTREPKKFWDLQTASLDRIDSSKGYIEGNVWWIHKDINKLKWDWTLEKLYKLCEDIVNYKAGYRHK